MTKQNDLKDDVPELDNWEEVEAANFIKFDNIGDSVEGQLIDRGKSDSYGFGLFTVQQGEESQRFHGSAQLDDLMLGVNIGDYIKVTYVDSQKAKKGEMKLFTVQRRKQSA